MSTPTQYSSIQHWPEDDRPREKLAKYGEHTLTDSELLAILLRTGAKGRSALDLAREVLTRFKTFRNMSHSDSRDWDGIKGMGPAKTAQIKAALEIGRRFREVEIRENGGKIRSSKDAADILMPRMRDLKVEVFKVLYLNAGNRLIDVSEEDEGSVNFARPVIRNIVHKALGRFAASIICAHNHPSGEAVPSREDRQFTEKLQKACDSVQLKLLDHIIIGDNRYYSFADEGLLG